MRGAIFTLLIHCRQQTKKGGGFMRKKEIEVITHGTIDMSKMNEQQQKALYVSLLARILTLYKEQLENEKED